MNQFGSKRMMVGHHARWRVRDQGSFSADQVVEFTESDGTGDINPQVREKKRFPEKTHSETCEDLYVSICFMVLRATEIEYLSYIL